MELDDHGGPQAHRHDVPVGVLIAFLLGGIFALLVRLELLTPSTVFGKNYGCAETYNRVFTLHGAIMVFLFIIPAIPAALGNFVLPLMLGRQGRGLSAAQSDSASICGAPAR